MEIVANQCTHVASSASRRDMQMLLKADMADKSSLASLWHAGLYEIEGIAV